MERLSLMILVGLSATAFGMPPTPLQHTIDSLFKTSDEPRALEESDDSDMDFSDDDKQHEQFDVDQESLYGDDDLDTFSSGQDTFSENQNTFSSGQEESLWRNNHLASVDLDDVDDGMDAGYEPPVDKNLASVDLDDVDDGMDAGFEPPVASIDDEDDENDDLLAGVDDDEAPATAGRDASSRVIADIARIRSKIPSMHLKDAPGTLDNMEAIARDAEELASGEISTSRRDRLKQATKLRMKSLHSQLNDKQEPSVTHLPSSNTPLRKVNQDIVELEEKLETLHLPASTMSETIKNLEQIEMNAKEISNPRTSESRREHLKEATSLRMKALRKQMNTRQAPSTFDEDDVSDVKVAKVDRDVEDITDKVNAMDMSESLREETLTNLAAITKDAHRISQSHGASRKRLQDAIKLRTTALKDELKPSTSSSVTPSVSRSGSLVSKVDRDLNDVLQKIDAAKLPSALAQETRDNIAAIKRDTHKIVHTHGEEHRKLEEAIKLRTRALKQELSIDKRSNAPIPSKAAKIAKVDRDIAALEEKVSHLHGPKPVMAEMTSNLAAIKKDSHILASANGAKRQRMAKALGLRTKALKSEFKALSE